MAKDTSPERTAELAQANIRVQGWLQTMFSAREALQAAAAGRQHANFDGMLQGFNELPSGTSLEVAPQPGVKLEARRFDTGARLSARKSHLYYSRRFMDFYHADGPFEGGALIIAKLEEVPEKDLPAEHDSGQALIGLSFHCLRPGHIPVPRGIAVNQVLDGVFVPGELPFETTFRVVDRPPIPSAP